MRMIDNSVGRSGDRAGGQVHGAARHLPFRGEGFAARGAALQAKALSEVDRQFSLGHGKEAQGDVTDEPRVAYHHPCFHACLIAITSPSGT